MPCAAHRVPVFVEPQALVLALALALTSPYLSADSRGNFLLTQSYETLEHKVNICEALDTGAFMNRDKLWTMHLSFCHF